MKFLERLKSHRLIGKYIKSTYLRTELFLRLGLAFNMGYAIFKLRGSFIYKSLWFGAVAVYYILLCSLKFYLLHRGFGSVSVKGELITFRNCSLLLLLLNLTITVLIYQMIYQNKGYKYSSIVIIGSVIYTFFRLLTSIVDSVKLKKLNRPTLLATKTLNLSVALMSMFSLQTSIFDRMNIKDGLKQSLNLLSGTAVGSVVIIIAVKMLIKAQKDVKRIK